MRCISSLAAVSFPHQILPRDLQRYEVPRSSEITTMVSQEEFTHVLLPYASYSCETWWYHRDARNNQLQAARLFRFIRKHRWCYLSLPPHLLPTLPTETPPSPPSPPSPPLHHHHPHPTHYSNSPPWPPRSSVGQGGASSSPCPPHPPPHPPLLLPAALEPPKYRRPCASSAARARAAARRSSWWCRLAPSPRCGARRRCSRQ